MDPVQQQKLIEQLIPQLRKKNFADIFAQLTESESNNGRFLLKMELQRKCASCRRVIDMRDALADECQVYEFKGMIHFMPAEAISLFQSQCFIYRDDYTMGVYEVMLLWQKQRQQARVKGKATAQANPFQQYEVKTIPFASYYGRRQERMHISSPVEVRLKDGAKLLAKTSDLSPEGIRISVSYLPTYQTGDQVEVIFTGLEHDSNNPLLQQPVQYQILGEENKEGRFWLILIRTGDNPTFDTFIKEFIKANKGHHRISVDHLLSAAIIKGHEQFYLPRMTGIPLFFSSGANPKLEIALRSENNQHLLEYWRDEKNRDALAGLFSADRMKHLCPAPGATKETLIYSFAHTVQNKIYFFSATSEELRLSGLTKLFFQVGAHRPSWRVYKFSLELCELAEADLGQIVGLEESQLHDIQLLERIKQIGYCGLLQEISLDAQREEFRQEGGTINNPNELQRFGHEQEPMPFEIELLQYVQLRKEQRYIHKTEITISHNGRSWQGLTRDISAHGMQIELEEAFIGEKNDVVTIALPRLQELAKTMDLQHLPYRLVSLNMTRTVLHLCIEGDTARHIGRQFFTLLIESNQKKLKTAPEHRRYRGLARALRNIYTSHLFNTPLYVNKLNGSPKPASIGKSLKPRSLQRVLTVCTANPEHGNLYPLFQGDLLKEVLMTPLRHQERDDKPKQEEVYVSYVQTNSGWPQIKSCLANSFGNVQEKRQFIEQALQQGEFYSVLVGISRTGRPDINFVANELDTIAKFAIHKAKKLEEDLWSVVGVSELTDTTEATLFRLGITQPLT